MVSLELTSRQMTPRTKSEPCFVNEMKTSAKKEDRKQLEFKTTEALIKNTKILTDSNFVDEFATKYKTQADTIKQKDNKEECTNSNKGSTDNKPVLQQYPFC